MSVPPPGWNPDPNLPAAAPRVGSSGWTAPDLSPQAHPAEPVADPMQFAAYDAPAAAASFQHMPPASQPAFAPAAKATLTQRNPTTITTIIVVALYLVLATTTGIVLIGIFPAMLAFRAFQRREPLAPIAVLAAAVAIISALTVLTHR
jgi:hypothetical protein